MNKAVANNERAGHAMAGDMEKREQLSALADGQLHGAELADALAYAAQDDEGRATWQMYHLVGDVLRSSDLARPSPSSLVSRLRVELAKEARQERASVPAQVTVVASTSTQAANASVFRWKMAAGVASLAAVAAIGWSSLASLQGDAQGLGGAQLAVQQSVERPAAAPATPAPVVAVVDAEGQQVMIRDPRLDELLAAHKQFGSTSALQMPAGFLRNATFETPGR